MSKPTITRSSPLRLNKTVVHFKKDRLPPARNFYECELGKLTRPNRKAWAQGRCPFHESKSGKSFSVNLDSGGFHCFGCDAKGGDIIAFVRLRDGCDFPTACKLLDCWCDVSEAERLKLDAEAAKRSQEREAAARAKAAERARRFALRNEIHTTIAIQAEASAHLDELLQGAAPEYPDECEHVWAVLALAHDDLRQTDAEYMQVCGLVAS